jgi:branched-chain amino acid transport system ATP-binding protein
VTTPVLELRGVTAGYGRVAAIDGVDLVVPARSVVALVGPNGAGKSTTLRVCAGLLRPWAGRLPLAGRDLTGVPAHALARAGVCMLPEGRGVFPNLTVRENLLMDTFAGDGRRVEDVEERVYGRFPVLGQRRHQVAGTLSGGEQQMLSLARAVATEPVLLLADEISLGLAPMIVEELFEHVASLAASGITVVLVEQFVEHALRIADVVVVMARGRVRDVGEPADVAPSIATAYLGATS